MNRCFAWVPARRVVSLRRDDLQTTQRRGRSVRIEGWTVSVHARAHAEHCVPTSQSQLIHATHTFRLVRMRRATGNQSCGVHSAGNCCCRALRQHHPKTSCGSQPNATAARQGLVRGGGRTSIRNCASRNVCTIDRSCNQAHGFRSTFAYFYS